MSYSFGGWEKDLDNYLTHDPRDDIEPFCTCSECDAEIYEGDYYYDVKGDIYCEDCMKEFKKEAEMEIPDYMED